MSGREASLWVGATEFAVAVYADSAYGSAEAEAMLAQKPVTRQIQERAYRHRPLTEAQKASNRQKSKIRARIEHVFGFMSQSMKGFYLALHWAAAQRGGDWPDQPDLQPGPLRTDRAPDFMLADQDGKAVSLGELLEPGREVGDGLPAKVTPP